MLRGNFLNRHRGYRVWGVTFELAEAMDIHDDDNDDDFGYNDRH